MSLHLHILTIAYNAMPFLPIQLATFNRLRVPWTWHLVEGPANNVNDTKWCKKQEPGLSTDGTHEFLAMLMKHPRCHIRWSHWWEHGKTQMCNAGIEHIDRPCVLLQCDADELWAPDQLEKIVWLFDHPNDFNCARFFCRYFLGQNIIAVGDNSYGNRGGEWLRAWKYQPGMRFKTHEPPAIGAINEPFDGWERCYSREETRKLGLVFDHHAYVYPSQVAYKEKFYNYPSALRHWERLQNHQGPWPVNLKTFLLWVDDKAQADLLHKP